MLWSGHMIAWMTNYIFQNNHCNKWNTVCTMFSLCQLRKMLILPKFVSKCLVKQSSQEWNSWDNHSWFCFRSFITLEMAGQVECIELWDIVFIIACYCNAYYDKCSCLSSSLHIWKTCILCAMCIQQK